jgi:hypothetical protein
VAWSRLWAAAVGVGEDLPGLVGDLLVLGRHGKAESVPATQIWWFVVSARWFAGFYFLLPAWAAAAATLLGAGMAHKIAL